MHTCCIESWPNIVPHAHMPTEKTEQTWKGPASGNKFAIDQARLKPFGSNKSANL
jgi:hypothetical protein